MSWRRVLLLSIALVVVIAVVTWTLLQRSDVATEMVKNQLSGLFRGLAGIGSTQLDLAAGRLSIDDFELADPTLAGSDSDRRLVRIASTHLDVQADPLAFRIEPRQVVIEGLEIECGPTWPEPADLLLLDRGADNGDGEPLPAPVIDIRSGRAVVHVRADEAPLLVDAIRLTATPLATAPRSLQLNGSFTLRDPAAVLTLWGEIDLDTGAARLDLSTTDVDCGQPIVARIARLAGAQLSGLRAGAAIRSLTVSCRIPPKTAIDRTPVFEVAAACQNVQFESPDLPSIVEDASVELYATTAERGMVQASVRQQNDDGEIDVTAKIGGLLEGADVAPSIEIRADGKDLVVDADVLAALRSFPIGRRIVEALQPSTGRAEIQLYLRNPHRSDNLTELELRMREVAMVFQGFRSGDRRIGFPLPLVAASGRVRLRDDILLLEDMQAQIAPSAGGGGVRLTGRIETTQASGEETTLDIECDSVAFSGELRRALSTLLLDDGDLYDRLAPSGRAKVQVAVRPMSQLLGGYRVAVQPIDAAMQWAGFPYRLDQLRGDIRVNSQAARFDLTGRHGDGALSMRGRIPLRDDHDPEDGFEAVVGVDHLTIDDELRRAVAVVVPELDAHAQRADPTGFLSGEVKVWRPRSDDQLLHDVRLELENVDLQLPVAPWRATGLQGQVLVQGAGSAARINFDALRGKLDNGKEHAADLALLGHVESAPTYSRDLAFVVRDLELCEQLGRSLDELDALEFATWTSLRPSGRVDLVCRDTYDTGLERAHDLQVVVQLVDVQSEAPMLPKTAEHMTGELRIQDGELTFGDVRGVLGGAQVRWSGGRVHQLPAPDGRTEISFSVQAKDFPVDDGLANLFSGPLRRAVLERRLRGQADVDGLRLRFRVPQQESRQPFATTIQGKLGLDGVDMLLGTGEEGIEVFDLRGVVRLQESTVNDAGGQLSGILQKGSLQLFGHAFDAIDASWVADAERLQLENLTSRLHDGQIRNAQPNAPALTYLLPSESVPEGRVAAELRFDRVDVFSLLTASGWNNPPYSGAASGTATLRRLDGNDVVGAEAEGKLVIERANLGKVPLFKAIYAQLPPADQPRFNFLDVTYRLTGQRLTFEDLEVRSDILAAKGAGTFDLDGYLDIRMELDNLLGTSADPVVMPLIDYLAKNLVRFHLYGHLRDLRAEQRWLTESSPGRRGIGPMPPKPAPQPAPGF